MFLAHKFWGQKMSNIPIIQDMGFQEWCQNQQGAACTTLYIDKLEEEAALTFVLTLKTRTLPEPCVGIPQVQDCTL